MMVVRDTNPVQFLEQAGSLLYQDEPTNSLLLGLCENMVSMPEPPKDAPVLLRVVENGRTLTAALQTPPMNLVITYATENALQVLAANLIQSQNQFPGVVGPAKESEIFANIWSKLSDKKSTLGMGQKIYKIEKVILPEAKGEMRPAQDNEIDLVAQWTMEFANESLPPPERKGLEAWRPLAIRKIEKEQVYLWIFNGKPVSMAHVGRPTQNGISVSGVYTPPPLRKNGYASAVVAHVSQKMLDSGKKFCVLYTDLSNPTSNKIYQNVGYKEVSDSKHFLFGEQSV